MSQNGTVVLLYCTNVDVNKRLHLCLFLNWSNFVSPSNVNLLLAKHPHAGIFTPGITGPVSVTHNAPRPVSLPLVNVLLTQCGPNRFVTPDFQNDPRAAARLQRQRLSVAGRLLCARGGRAASDLLQHVVSDGRLFDKSAR